MSWFSKLLHYCNLIFVLFCLNIFSICLQKKFVTVELFCGCGKFHNCGTVLWLWNSWMIMELFYDCRKVPWLWKNFLIAEKIIGVIILKQWRYVVSDSTIIKLPVLILSALARLYNLMVKTRDYQHMGLLRMHVQNQWKASSMTVESSLNVEQLFQEGLGI